MLTPKLFDVIEVLSDVPEQGVRAGMRGTLVEQYTPEAFEVEFLNREGETLALCPLKTWQFIVVWQAESQQSVPLENQTAQIITRLPEKAGEEILDFARFIGARQLANISNIPESVVA
jgi:hypothetical protein